MKKEFRISADLVIGLTFNVEAVDTEEAIRLVREKLINETQYYASKGYYIDDDITDVELIENEE